MIDVALLAFLRPSSQENDELIAVFTEIDPIAGSEIDAILVDAATHTLHIREIPALKPSQSISSRSQGTLCTKGTTSVVSHKQQMRGL
jgi:hypothetical protein